MWKWVALEYLDIILKNYRHVHSHSENRARATKETDPQILMNASTWHVWMKIWLLIFVLCFLLGLFTTRLLMFFLFIVMSLTCHVSLCGLKLFSPFCQKEVILCWNINTWHEVMACCSEVPALKTTSLCLVTQCKIILLMRGLINLYWTLYCQQTPFVSFGWKHDETIQPPFPVDRLPSLSTLERPSALLPFNLTLSCFLSVCVLSLLPLLISQHFLCAPRDALRGEASRWNKKAPQRSVMGAGLVVLLVILFCFYAAVLFPSPVPGRKFRERKRKIKRLPVGQHKVVTVLVCVSQYMFNHSSVPSHEESCSGLPYVANAHFSNQACHESNKYPVLRGKLLNCLQALKF